MFKHWSSIIPPISTKWTCNYLSTQITGRRRKKPRHNYGVWNPVLGLGQALESDRVKSVDIRIVHGNLLNMNIIYGRLRIA